MTFQLELQKYQTTVEIFNPDIDNLLHWWYARKNAYPRLSLIAKKLLGFPSSSASAERVFSKVRLLITENRQSMNENTVKGLMLGSCL